MNTLAVILGGILCLIGMTIVIVGVETGRKQLTKKWDMSQESGKAGLKVHDAIFMANWKQNLGIKSSTMRQVGENEYVYEFETE